MKRRSVLLGTGLVLLCGSATIWFGNDVALSLESSAPSRSIGTVGNGRLENGKRLPAAGPNFRSYSRLGALLGRTAVHSGVRAAVLEVKNFGLIVELPDVLLTGMIHISALTDDFYTFNAAQRRLINAQTAITEAQRFFEITQQLERGGEAARADVIKSQIDLQSRQRDVHEAIE